MRDALLWQGEVRLVSHVRVGDGLARPELREISVTAACPFGLSRVQPMEVRLVGLSEETPTVDVDCRITDRAIALNRVRGHRRRPVGTQNRREKFLRLTILAAPKDQFLLHRLRCTCMSVEHRSSGIADITRDAVL